MLYAARVLVLLLSLALAGPAYSETAGTSGSAAAPLLIGALYNTSGQQRVLDVPSVNGARLAVEQLNAAGGIMQRPLHLLVVDGRSEVPVVAEKTRELIDENPAMVALMGASDTDLVLPAAKAAAASGRLFLTSGATSPKLPAEVPGYLFLACFGDNVQAAAAAQFAHSTLNARTAAVIYDSEKTYTSLLQGYFRTQFESFGGAVESVGRFTVDDMQGIADGVAQADIIFLAAQQAEDAVRALAILRAAGFSMPVIGGDGYDAPAVWATHPAVKDVYYTTHAYFAADNPDPAVVAFIAAYAEAYGGEQADSFAGLGYDAVGLLANAISRAGSDEPDKVREALAATRDYRGVTGTISFTGGSRIPTKSVALVAIADGKPSLVTEILPASVPPP